MIVINKIKIKMKKKKKKISQIYPKQPFLYPNHPSITSYKLSKYNNFFEKVSVLYCIITYIVFFSFSPLDCSFFYVISPHTLPLREYNHCMHAMFIISINLIRKTFTSIRHFKHRSNV